MNTLKYFPDEAAPPGQETWMNGGNGTMISNRGNSKPIEGYVQRPVGGTRASGGGLSALPRKLSDDEIATQANQMVQAGMPDEQIQNWIIAQQSMPDVQMTAPPAASAPPKPPKPPKLSALEQRIKIARENGATDAEIKAIIMGGKGGPKASTSEPKPAKSLDATKGAEQRKALRQDAINFAAAWLGKSPEDLAKMTPQEIREAVAKGGRMTTGPIMGSIWGMSKIANSDLEAYKSSAAAKQARINNPSGPVTEGDFRAAEKSIFSPDKPAQVNADLIYQALTSDSEGQTAPSGSVAPKKIGRFQVEEN